jgi:diaminohydroxyphosphoribosylaminopyrimidine deaminase/5-amino-6-(5-phosphoribosylamino)uracil reductase
MNNYTENIKKTFELSLKGLGCVSPNPLVGCVITDGDKIVATGYHAKLGEDHAERDALKKLNFKASGYTLYCNLEPCCHLNKRTPPCAQMIIEAGIKKVVISNLDPNPMVRGEGVKLLRQAGIEVVENILESEGLKLNERFFKYIQTGIPFIETKIAMTLDGKIAKPDGTSKWITNSSSREMAHQRRNLYDAIVIGAQTLRHDNPTLSIRLNEAERFIPRIVFSESGNIDTKHNLFSDQHAKETLLVTKSLHPLINQDNQFIYSEVFPWSDFYVWLKNKHIYSLFVEGGANLISFFINHNQVDRMTFFIAPKIMGNGISFAHQFHDRSFSDLLTLKNSETQMLSGDLMVTGLIKG